MSVNNLSGPGATEHAPFSGPIELSPTDVYQGFTTNNVDSILASLADGTVGQKIIIRLTNYDTHPLLVTPANMNDGTTISFDAHGMYAVLVFVGTGWTYVYGTAAVE